MLLQNDRHLPLMHYRGCLANTKMFHQTSWVLIRIRKPRPWKFEGKIDFSNVFFKKLFSFIHSFFASINKFKVPLVLTLEKVLVYLLNYLHGTPQQSL